MNHWINPVTLRGEHAQLEPLAPVHREALGEAVRDGELWKLWYTSAPRPETLDTWLETALDQREHAGAMPFAVRRLEDSRIVGATRMFNVDAVNRRLEIGHTWCSQRAQRTAINTECKLMLLAHAFGSLGCVAVEFRTHFMNRDSRRAIERLGAKLDGILRNHQLMPNGSLRDTCVYSVIATEWPAVQANLSWQLERRRAAGHQESPPC